MDKEQFIVDMFKDLYPYFVDELQDYDEDAGETCPKFSDVYLSSFDKAARAAADAYRLVQTAINQ